MDVRAGSLPDAREPAAPGRAEGVRVEKIVFPTWNPFLPRDMHRKEIRDRRVPGKGRLFLPGPEFPRPRPAVVVMQGLGGPKKQREIAYGHFLARNGYVALTANSFATRGVGWAMEICRALRVTAAMLMADAFGALAWLPGHPEVARDRIAVVGFSFGGMISILTAYRRMRDLYLPDGPAFMAHVSYYGSSIPRMEDPTTMGAPALIMVGKKDRNVSISRTEQIAKDLRRGGSPVDLEIFDAYHQWDGPHDSLDRALFHLRDCHIRIGNDGSLTDEKTGHRIDGPWSHFLFLLRNSAISGYLMQRNPAILDRSNALLLSFLKNRLSPRGARRGMSEGRKRITSP